MSRRLLHSLHPWGWEQDGAQVWASHSAEACLPPLAALTLPVPPLSGQLSRTRSLILFHSPQTGCLCFLCCLSSSRCAFLSVGTIPISLGPSNYLAHLS